MDTPDRTRLRRSIALTAPLAMHVIPTLIIGFGFVIPGSPIAGVNQYTVGFAASILGFIPIYVAGLRISARKRNPSDG
jgi:hypothetical protein